ncbi:hypothetical protein [Achromobacter insolitus]|uniref:hypothetical protein n=1 Tax=Achromobacter insolitus TaxID=217204 RepID=UPI00366C989C
MARGPAAAGIRVRYEASVYALVGAQAEFTVLSTSMGVFSAARSLAGRLTAVRRACFDSTAMLWHYTVLQGLLSLGHGPWLSAAAVAWETSAVFIAPPCG